MVNKLSNYIPDILTKAEIMAFKALYAGTANENQQKIALVALYEKICGVGDLSFHAENERITSFNEGKRHCGIQIIKTIQFDFAKQKNQGLKKA